jgi:hypothetical protein
VTGVTIDYRIDTGLQFISEWLRMSCESPLRDLIREFFLSPASSRDHCPHLPDFAEQAGLPGDAAQSALDKHWTQKAFVALQTGVLPEQGWPASPASPGPPTVPQGRVQSLAVCPTLSGTMQEVRDRVDVLVDQSGGET